MPLLSKPGQTAIIAASAHPFDWVIPKMSLIVLRCVFLLVAAGAAISLVNSQEFNPEWLVWVVFASVMSLALLVIGVDLTFKRKQIDTISAVYFGLLIGLFLTYIIGIALTPLFDFQESVESDLRPSVLLVLGMVLCYTCISLLIQTKDDFRFIIPYVEFAKDVKGLKPYILDTSAVIDGRIADVIETNMLDNQMIMPRFVLTELQNIADSSDKMRRSRGRRGLDILNRLRSNKLIDFQIHDRELPEMGSQPVDVKLVLLAKHLDGKLVTGDYNLNKVAKLHSVPVINLNDLANALKPVFLPGEVVNVKIVKAGEEDGQGVGYLDDGTMIVIEGGRPHIGSEVRMTVTSVLQTSAGRLILITASGEPADGAPK